MNWQNIFFWATTLIIIALSIYVLVWIRSENYQCVSNPYVYSIKLLEKANLGNVSCVCTNYRQYGSARSVLLDINGFHQLEDYQMNEIAQETPLINYSSIWDNTKN